MDTVLKQEIKTSGKRIELFGNTDKASPLIIYHAVHGEGKELWASCNNPECPACSLAVINDVLWNDEMTPWEIPPISRGDPPFTGGADAYITKLTDLILPFIRASLPQPPTKIILAGYSLAGLFAVYAVFRTDVFSEIASASGSLWYPGLLEFIKAHPISENMKAAYLSLGNKESLTHNPVLSTVEKNTRETETCLHLQGIDTFFESNPGNHYKDAVPRMAKGIQWLLKHKIQASGIRLR